MLKKILAFTVIVSGLFLFANTENVAKASSMKSDELEKIIATFDLTNPEKQEQVITLPNNETAVVGLKPIIPTESAPFASNGTYQAYWYSGLANCEFYFDVSNNKITRAYDGWYLFVGATVESAKLKLDSSKQATYYFEFGTPIWDFGGWSGWLRAKINSKNEIEYSIK